MATRKLVIKTRQNTASVPAFITAVKDPERRADCRTLLKLMQVATGQKPKMWGTSIVGFGTQTYQSGGKEGEWFLVGFSRLQAAERLADITVGWKPRTIDRPYCRR